LKFADDIACLSVLFINRSGALGEDEIETVDLLVTGVVEEDSCKEGGTAN